MQNYQKLISQALMDVVKQILTTVATHGVTGNQHFAITFKTDYSGVVLPDFVREKFPTEITVLLQHQFENLKLTEMGIGVDLSFSGRFFNVFIPFNSIECFADPSQDFALYFHSDFLSESPKKTAEIIDFADLRK